MIVRGLAGAIRTALPRDLAARPATPSDEPAVRALHASTLPPGLGDGPLADLQLTAQRRGFREALPEGEELVVSRDDVVVARLCLGREPEALRIVDVVVAPEARRQGVGREVVRAVQASAATEGLAVRLRVVRGELPAEALYASLGFVLDEGAQPDEVRDAMIWRR